MTHLGAVVLGMVDHMLVRLLDQMLLQLERGGIIAEVLRRTNVHSAGSLGRTMPRMLYRRLVRSAHGVGGRI